jgi:hydrogenase maturation protease
MARVRVLGIGNVLNQDDGVGPFTARTLVAGWELPPDVEVLDAGTPGLDLVGLLQGLSAVVLVDAVADEGAPGEVRRLDRAQLLRGGKRLVTSPHEPGLREALQLMEFQGGAPADVTLWGAIPACTTLGTALTPAVRGAVPALLEGVLSELRRLGVEPRRREVPSDPDIWWERAPALG